MEHETQEKEAGIPARPGYVWSTCNQCEKEFEAVAVPFKTSTGTIYLKAGICGPCDLRMKSKDEQDRIELERISAEWDRRCPREYADTDISKIPHTQWQEGQRWIMSINTSGFGLIIGGPPRRRKTRMAWMLLKQVHFVCKKKWDAFLWSTFMGEIVDAYKSGEESVEDIISNACHIPILFIDDLAQDVATPRTAETAKRIIEERTSNQLPTIITMNATGDNLVKRYGEFGEQIKGRLTDYFQIVAFK